MENLIISNGVKKLILIICLFFLIPVLVQAALVPCGCDSCPCTLCHFFLLLDRVVDFLILEIVPIAATLMLVVGGVMFLTSAGNPNTVEKAKKIMTSVIFGLMIIFTAWLIINTLLFYLGYTGPIWWQIDCPFSCTCP